MATPDKIISWLQKNPQATDADIFAIMQASGTTPEQLAQATGKSVEAVQQRYDNQYAQALTVPVPTAPPALSGLLAQPSRAQPTLPTSANQGGSGPNVFDSVLKTILKNTSAGQTPADAAATAAIDRAAGAVLEAGGSAAAAEAAAQAAGAGLNGGLTLDFNPATILLKSMAKFIKSKWDSLDARQEAYKQWKIANNDAIAAAGLDVNSNNTPEAMFSSLGVSDVNAADLDPTGILKEIGALGGNRYNFPEDTFGPSTVSEQAQATTGGATPQGYKEIPASQAPPQDAVEGVFQDTAGATWGYDVQGNKWKIADAPEVATLDNSGGGGGGGGSDSVVDTTIVTGDPSLSGGDIPAAPEKPVEGDTVVTNANAKGRDGSTIVWTHRNPDGSVVASDPMGEIWEVSPPTEKQTPVTPTIITSTAGPAQGTSTGTGPGTGTGGTGTGTGGTGTGTSTADSGTTPDSPVTVGPVPTTDTTPDPGDTTGAGPGTGPGTGPDTGGAKGGMFGLGATETTQMVFPELYKLSSTPYTLVGNLLSRPNRGLFS